MTGAETSTVALIERQTEAGHQIFVVAGKFEHAVKAAFYPVSIHDRGWVQRLVNIGALIRLIRKEKIDIVHAHSRAASWVSFWACRMTRTPYLSTLHGRQHLHFSNRNFNVYGKKCVVMCENIREQMLKETKIFKPEQLIVIRNGILP